MSEALYTSLGPTKAEIDQIIAESRQESLALTGGKEGYPDISITPSAPEKRKYSTTVSFSRFNMRIPPGVHLPCQNNDPEDFYEVSDKADPRDPKVKYLAKICSSCVYIKECLSEELDLSPWEQHGFRAGLTAQQRARIIRKNRAKK